MPLIKKYWLDGIFDEAELNLPEQIEEVVKNQEFIEESSFKGSKIGYVFKNGEKGIGYYSDSLNLIIPEKSVVDEVNSSFKFILCKDYMCCSNYQCVKRHWYNNRYENRLSYSKIDKGEEERALRRAYIRFQRMFREHRVVVIE